MCSSKIKNASEALEVFNAKFEKLIGKVENKFTKRFIQILGDGEEFLAYVSENKETNENYVVPFHTDKSPTIEKSTSVKIVKEIKTPTEAYKAFCMEYASLARLINPAAKAFDGYLFEKKTLQIRQGGIFTAFAAFNTAKEYYFIVPVDGGVPKIETYDEVTVIE